MAYAKSDTGILNHRKFLGLDPAAIGLWTMGNAYCSDQLTDGLIPVDQVPRLVSVTLKRAYALADLLVSRRLWQREGQDYCVHDWLEHNPSRAQVLANRAYERERKAKRKPGGVPPSQSAGNPAGNPGGIPAGVPPQAVAVAVSEAVANPLTPTPDGGNPVERPRGRSGDRVPQPTDEWLNGYQRGAFRWDCPDPQWHGHCVDPSWPGLKPVLKRCPIHRATAQASA